MRFGGNTINNINKIESFSAGYTVAIATLGCKLNQAESEVLSGQLHDSGYRIVSSADKADVYILNTCTVTHIADRKSRHLIRMAHRQNPDAKIVVMGCYAQRATGELSDIEGVSLVVDNSQKANLVELLGKLDLGSRDNATEAAFEKPNRTRSFIKAQDGCNNFCTYCIVPLVRGRETSLPPEQIAELVKGRVSEGYREIVLTGTEIGRYRYASLDLTQLLVDILTKTEIPRLRLSSLQPQEIKDELLSLWKDPRLCRHFHISLQSGSDGILQRMNRRYSTKEYAETLARVRSAIPGVAVTTDVIVGFPGETRAEFEESYNFCSKMDFARIHVFPYSVREGTMAARMPLQTEPQEKKQRTEAMLRLARTSLENYVRKFLEDTLPVLFEQKSGNLWSGLTDNYIKVYANSFRPLTNQLLKVKLQKMVEDGVRGLIIE